MRMPHVGCQLWTKIHLLIINGTIVICSPVEMCPSLTLELLHLFHPTRFCNNRWKVLSLWSWSYNSLRISLPSWQSFSHWLKPIQVETWIPYTLIEKLNEKLKGYENNNICSAFADDMVLVTDRIDHMKQGFEVVQQYCLDTGMELNLGSNESDK